MNDNEAVVRIVGDASQVAPAISQTKSQILGLDAVIDAAAAGFREGFGTELKAAMAQGANATEQMTQEMRQLEAATDREARSLREMAHGVNEGVEGFNSFKRTLMGIGEIYMAAFAVERIVEWAKEFGEAAEKTQHLADTFGVPSMAGGSLRTSEGLTMIHEDEAVIPAWGADGLRNMIAAFAGASGMRLPAGMNLGSLTPAQNDNARAAANSGGDTHNYYNIQALDGHSVKRLLMNNSKHVAAAGDAGIRAGYQPKNASGRS